MRSWSLEMEMQKESPRIPRVMKRYFPFVTVETLPYTLSPFLPSSLPACLRLSLLIPSSLPPSLPPSPSPSHPLPPPPPPHHSPSLSLKSRAQTPRELRHSIFFYFQLSNMMHRKIQRQNLQPPGTTRREKEAVTTTARTTRTRFLTKKFALAR